MQVRILLSPQKLFTSNQYQFFMQPPKRIRLLHVLYNRLYSRVKVQLATDKEVKALHELASRIARYYDKQKESVSNNNNTQLTLSICH